MSTATTHPQSEEFHRDSSSSAALGLLKSTSTVSVHLINTTISRTSAASDLFRPFVCGFTTARLPSNIFLISHAPSSTNILFDLGIRKDWQTGFPPVFTPEVLSGFNISTGNDVADILNSSHGINLSTNDIDAVIWSHHHFDHRGDISLFPSHTQLVIGTGLRAAHQTYPPDEEGEIWQSEFEGRMVRELSVADFKLNIGGFPAYDFFGDGSFYVLATAGHTVGHLSALARVIEDTFVFLAGDVAHHCGVFRPSSQLPLPEVVELGGKARSGKEIVEKLHPYKDAKRPFLDVDEEPMCYSHQHVVESVMKLQVFDADENVLVCIAHDPSLMDIVNLFPNKLDDWKVRGWKEKARWRFLEDFDLQGCERTESKAN